jgi:hypothetical protein
VEEVMRSEELLDAVLIGSDRKKKNLVISLKWVLDTKTDRLAD